MPEVCPKCNKTVYAAERRPAGGKAWHAMCLKCGACNKMLDSTNVAEHEGEVYCKQCHGRKFGPKGYGFGGGAGALNMDSKYATNDGGKPTAGIIGKVVSPEEGGCPRCGKRVYDAEKAVGCPDGLHFHKPCFRCKDCNKALDSTILCTNKEAKEVYCKTCYGKNFGPSGFRAGGAASSVHTA